MSSCTSCSSSPAPAARSYQREEQDNYNAAAAQATHERLQVQPAFIPDPSRVLDIQA